MSMNNQMNDGGMEDDDDFDLDSVDLTKGVVMSPQGTGPGEGKGKVGVGRPPTVDVVSDFKVGGTYREYEVWGTDEKGRGGYYWKGVTWRRLAALRKAYYAWMIERQRKAEYDTYPVRTWEWKVKTSCNGKGKARDEAATEKVVNATKVNDQLPPKL